MEKNFQINPTRLSSRKEKEKKALILSVNDKTCGKYTPLQFITVMNLFFRPHTNLHFCFIPLKHISN